MEKLVNQTKKPLTDAEKQFMFKDYKDKLMAKCPLKFSIERDDFEENKESLRISTVEGEGNENASVTDFALTIQSLNDPDCYWLDSGAFNINIKANR